MRGVYQKSATGRVPRVGISLYHTVGDRERALDQINTGFRALSDDVMAAAGWRADPYHAAEGPIWDWWHLVGVPKMEEWQKFYADQWASAAIRWATNWETFEGWQTQLENLRKSATAQGIQLKTPSAAPLPTTLPGDVLDAGGSALKQFGKDTEKAVTDLTTIVKVALYGVLVVGGLVVVTSVVSNARKGFDPMEKYADLYRKVRR